MRRARALLAGLGLCAAPGMVRAQHPLVALPLSDPAYAQLDGLMRQGCRAARVSPYRPYLVQEIRGALARAAADPACGGVLLRSLAARFAHDTVGPPAASETRSGFSVGAAVAVRGTALHNGEIVPLWNDIRPTAVGDPHAVGDASLRVTWSGGPRLLAVSEAYAQTSRRNDPLVRAARLRRTSGVVDFNDAYLAGRLGRLVLSLGRAREAWLGEGSESLVLSANGPPIDRILADVRWSRFEVRALLASLNDVVVDTATDGVLPDGEVRQRWHRVLVGHGFTYRPVRSVELTLGETALLQRQGGGLDLGFANPLMLYQVTQHDSTRGGSDYGDPNLTAFGGVRATVGRATLHGEWLVDDIQIDASDRRTYPNLFGWLFEGSYALPLPLPAAVGVQYRRIDSYTYSKKLYSEVYQQYDRPLGSELGPDADFVRGYGELWGSGRLHLVGGIGRWRRGAQRIDQRPSVDRKGHAGEPFPSTTLARPEVQRSWVGDGRLEWLDAVLPVSVSGELAHVSNTNNEPGAPRNFARVRLEASYRFRYP